MVLNKIETKRMLKVKSDLEDMFDNGHLNKYGVVPYTAKEIAMCYDGLIYDVTHSTVTGSTDVKIFFEKRGFLIEEMEASIGWNIYISDRVRKLCAFE